MQGSAKGMHHLLWFCLQLLNLLHPNHCRSFSAIGCKQIFSRISLPAPPALLVCGFQKVTGKVRISVLNSFQCDSCMR